MFFVFINCLFVFSPVDFKVEIHFTTGIMLIFLKGSYVSFAERVPFASILKALRVQVCYAPLVVLKLESILILEIVFFFLDEKANGGMVPSPKTRTDSWVYVHLGAVEKWNPALSISGLAPSCFLDLTPRVHGLY